MSRKAVEFDKSLQDKVKEFWETWFYEDVEFQSFEDFLYGYFHCYYNGNFKEIEAAVDFFDKKAREWENEAE